MATYDTKKIRLAATTAKQLENSFREDVREAIPTLQGEVEQLQGRTARAMEDGLSALTHTAASLHSELERITYALNRYADLLEEADQELARRIE